jgi:hypothetical protein
MSLFAHAGHVIVDLLYALPLFIMVGLLLVGRFREKRARGKDPEYWCDVPGVVGYSVYRAAEDRADAAELALAEVGALALAA